MRRTVAISLPQLWGFLAIALPVVAALVSPLSTVDLAYNIRAGQLMLESGRLLTTDPFTFTAGGRPWLDQQWASQALFGLVYGAGGWVALALLRAALTGMIYSLVFTACEAAGAGRRTAALLTLASFAISLIALALRPQLLGMALFAVDVWILATSTPHPRRVWALPLLAVIWSNVHGSFVLAPAIAGVWWLGSVVARRGRARRGLAVVLATAAATLVNPFGFGAWSYAIGLSTNPQIRRLLVEWQPTSILAYPGALFVLSVVAVVVVVLTARRSIRFLWPSILWLVALAALGFSAERGIVWWALGAPPVVARLLRDASVPRPRVEVVERGSALNVAIAAVVVLAGLLALPWWRAGATAADAEPLLADAPATLSTAVSSGGAGPRVFVPEAWGSWFELAVPDAQVFVDSRIELFSAGVWDDYLAVVSGAPSTPQILDWWQVSAVIASRVGQPRLVDAMGSLPGWRLAYGDSSGVMFTRASPKVPVRAVPRCTNCADR